MNITQKLTPMKLPESSRQYNRVPVALSLSFRHCYLVHLLCCHCSLLTVKGCLCHPVTDALSQLRCVCHYITDILHRHSSSVASPQSSCHCQCLCHGVTITLSLSWCLCYSVSVTLSLSRCLHHDVSVTLSRDSRCPCHPAPVTQSLSH